MRDETVRAYSHFRRQLEQSETALLHRNRAVLFRHGRWHYLALGDQGNGMGIQTLNFLSPARAESLLTEWLAGGARPVAYAHISPIWSAEVAEKILPATEAIAPCCWQGGPDWWAVGRQIRFGSWAARRAICRGMKQPFCPSWCR